MAGGYGAATLPGGPRAGFWVRVGARLLDYLLYGLLLLPFVIPGGVLIGSAYQDCVTIGDELFCPPGSPDGAMIGAGIALIAVGFLVVMVIYIRALGKSGQTWGRKITNIKVVGKNDGVPIGIGRAVGRILIQMVFGIVPLVPLLDNLWMLWDDDKQTLHDKVVTSVVVKV
ncbi:MAG: RDD family protein [Ilumatobacteraceae bacterium]